MVKGSIENLILGILLVGFSQLLMVSSFVESLYSVVDNFYFVVVRSFCSVLSKILNGISH